jgi:hypothetical protein
MRNWEISSSEAASHFQENLMSNLPSEAQPSEHAYMPSRRVFTNGWTYWLSKHQDQRLLLFDPADQNGVSVGNLRVFELATKSTIELTQDALRLQTTADVSDSDFVKLVSAYNEFKKSLGKLVKVPGYEPRGSLEDRHKKFLRDRGLPDCGIRPATVHERHRVTHCWSCKEHLDNSVDLECAACGWIICGCGACGCGK